METLASLPETLSYPMILAVGIAIRLIIGMRQFNRRGVGGLQHFSNYFIGLITLFVEWVLKWAANALVVWGMLGMIFT